MSRAGRLASSARQARQAARRQSAPPHAAVPIQTHSNGTVAAQPSTAPSGTAPTEGAPPRHLLPRRASQSRPTCMCSEFVRATKPSASMTLPVSARPRRAPRNDWVRERAWVSAPPRERQAVGQQTTTELCQKQVGARRGAGLVHQPGERRGQIHAAIMRRRPLPCHPRRGGAPPNFGQSSPLSTAGQRAARRLPTCRGKTARAEKR